MHRFTSRLVAAAMLLCLCGLATAKPPLPDGEFFGYEFLPNRGENEGPGDYRFYSCVLRIKNGAVMLKKFPRQMIEGKVWSSSSDGGFPVFEGNIIEVGDRTLISLRKVSCDYCAVSKRDPLPSKIIREYVLRFESQTSFELDRIIYSNKPDLKLEIPKVKGKAK